MDEKETLEQLTQILGKYELTEKEKTAIKHAIGVLSWTVLRAGAVKSIKARQTERRKRAVSK
jgi:hypothetical protein